MEKIDFNIEELYKMKAYPKTIFYKGKKELLFKPKISIVGTRRPSSYTKNFTSILASKLSQRGIVIVSGAAMGVDAIAHNASKNSTIAVMANGLNIKYPSVNSKLISYLETNALTLSTYENNEKARAYTFVQRNELVVALGEVLIICEADLNSGSLRSAQFALNQGKQIYVLPHRLKESEGTLTLAKNRQAKIIYDIDTFVNKISPFEEILEDEFLIYCKNNPSYIQAYKEYGLTVDEYELEGLIKIENGNIYLI